MINFSRVFAMVLRYFIIFRHSFDRLSDMFYWPALDLFIWGLTGLYFAQQTHNANAIFVMLNGLVFWIIIWRACYEISINLLGELWDRNIINIFITPLTFPEWTISFVIVGFIKTVVSITFSALVSFILYKFNIFIYGFWLIPFMASLLLTGWAAGFFVSGFLIRYGLKIQTFAWTGVALIAPFSALYYSLSILPPWAQKVALFIPASYVFESMRNILFDKPVSIDMLLVSFALNILYLILSIWFFATMFYKSKKLGLGRLI